MELRDYQIYLAAETVKLLQWLKIAYLALEVRTGKTLTALSAADQYGAKVVLFVTKKKAISSIQDDYDKLGPAFIIDIINFESLHNVVRKDYDLIIVDEAHGLGQYPTPSERTRSLKKICAGLPIIYLSGTPSPESFSQLYHQFYISSFSPFREFANFYAWAKEFVTVKKKYYYNREMNSYDDANKEKIDQYTRHLFLSFTQEEAGFEQMVEEQILKVQMQPTTYGLVRKLIANRIYIGRDGQEILADTAVKLQNKVHQIFSGSVIAENGEGVVFDFSKASFIKRHFAGQKIAIFYKFVCERMMLIATFGYDNLTEDPKEFNERNDKIFFSQVQSGREGTNLSTAEAIVMFNIDFSSVSYQQARARMQVKERTKPALLYWIFAEGGIEENIYERVKAKQEYTVHHFRKDYNIRKELV